MGMLDFVVQQRAQHQRSIFNFYNVYYMQDIHKTWSTED